MVSYVVTPIHALEKLFPQNDPDDSRISRVTGLAGETVSFQLAYRVESGGDADEQPLSQRCVNEFVTHLKVSGKFADRAHVRTVQSVYVDFPAYPGTTDDAYLSEEPGLYPDLLQDTDGWVAFMPNQWRALWVDIDLPADDVASAQLEHSEDSLLEFVFSTRNGDEVARASVAVHCIPAQLPALTLQHTEWLYADCLAQWYGVPVWSEEHWAIIERFVRLAAKRGMTMIYTPLFTPPLDTVVGGERLTTQLVGVSRTNGEWSFDFVLFERWVAMCQSAGIHQFEMSHLFTQWGAAHCPKVIATIDGVEQKLFGWSASATDPADGYPEFLGAFLPALDRELHQLGIAHNTVFHVSDEPITDNLDSYLAAKRIVQPYLKDYRIMDALSHVEFYKSGACEHPIPADDAIEPFVQAGAKDLWVYYCCAQTTNVPNRFMAMPSYRNRVLGFLLYTYDLAGFLHWGLNFYNSQFSMRPINPYTEAGTAEGFAAGDAFLLYPGPGGVPEESIRMMVMEEALNDLRACRLLESLIGREEVLSLIHEGLDSPLTFERYPHNADWLLGRRAAIDQAIERAL
ncbi:DUF4091 domain-containing protein [Bifidobacterium imperatoris]|uniref:DUF4091 domain-containing protein n=1 Tax=Bifidobacterium imperatoris TaxID=2020965 RepID=A0A2N5ITQ1_9BIFI|nr:DUF4091 domain-containing protein [Bifidobacterium imperatoris]PLS25345.1 hypothetical protein Tam1G_0547 [Bifidobacterium imperatoris]QSY58496.1 DUF4091 domain-containing protein [Bifidobacterium imperatoris]